MATRIYCKKCGSYSSKKAANCEKCGIALPPTGLTKADLWAALIGFPLAFTIIAILTPLTKYGIGGMETVVIMLLSYYGVRSAVSKKIENKQNN
jgi:hypothetical protein